MTLDRLPPRLLDLYTVEELEALDAGETAFTDQQIVDELRRRDRFELDR